MFQLLVSTNLFPHFEALFFSKYCHIIGIRLSKIAHRLAIDARSYFLWSGNLGHRERIQTASASSSS